MNNSIKTIELPSSIYYFLNYNGKYSDILITTISKGIDEDALTINQIHEKFK